MSPLGSSKQLRRYSQSGEILDEANLPRFIESLELLIVQEMREDGYVPILELMPRVYIEYLGDDDFAALVEMYGVYIGKRRAQVVEGVENWKPIQRSLQKLKSKQ